MDCRVIALGFVILCLHFGPASGTLLKPVTNVKWKSFNFRTTLQWEKTSENVVYTVRLTDKKSDWKKKPECTQMEATSCDLTSLMQNVNATYFAEVLSFDVTITEENEQPPFTKSPEIQLLKDTEIGQASFKIVKNETEIQLTIEDPLTHIRFSNKTPKTLRDIYGPELEYKVFYWKDRTSGKKTKIVKGQVLLMDVDPGFSYCFSIQPYIRSLYKNGQESSFQCTHSSEGFLSDYGLGAYALVGLGVLLILSIFIGITVFLCRRKTVHNIPEANPLTV
ncbi:coagulation factor IIIa [Pristis pectinata]|uniref:coagulation factor IIIa n=1 Tax=Pristis pectinata TaxID=685728 RepID=UPI00223E2A2E|nr:coagulation factor IIIa [Pristis pectinata]